MIKFVHDGGRQSVMITDDQAKMLGDTTYYCNECEGLHLNPELDLIEGAKHAERVIGCEVCV